MKALKYFLHFLFFDLLTLVTQVGGVIWIITLLLSKKFKFKKRFVLPVVYLIFYFLIIPVTASFFGRTSLPINSKELKCISWFYPLAFRNYVNPELKNLLIEVSKSTNQQLIYLDANFPFFDGFPLLPHLSHNDGKKIDLAFYYKTKDNKETNTQPSFFGYGNFVKSENKTNNYCKNKGYWQYDITKYLSLFPDKGLKFDTLRTRKILKTIAQKKNIQKIFIEPYLINKLKLQSYRKIIFHGCHAVRHDDHIHLQVY